MADTAGHPSRATLDKDPAEVAQMFDGVARRYDITNTVLSFGQDRRWRTVTRKALALTPSDVVLGSGRRHRGVDGRAGQVGARCIAADFSSACSRPVLAGRCPRSPPTP